MRRRTLLIEVRQAPAGWIWRLLEASEPMSWEVRTGTGPTYEEACRAAKQAHDEQIDRPRERPGFDETSNVRP